MSWELVAITPLRPCFSWKLERFFVFCCCVCNFCSRLVGYKVKKTRRTVIKSVLILSWLFNDDDDYGRRSRQLRKSHGTKITHSREPKKGGWQVNITPYQASASLKSHDRYKKTKIQDQSYLHRDPAKRVGQSPDWSILVHSYRKRYSNTSWKETILN